MRRVGISTKITLFRATIGHRRRPKPSAIQETADTPPAPRAPPMHAGMRTIQERPRLARSTYTFLSVVPAHQTRLLACCGLAVHDGVQGEARASSARFAPHTSCRQAQNRLLHGSFTALAFERAPSPQLSAPEWPATGRASAWPARAIAPLNCQRKGSPSNNSQRRTRGGGGGALCAAAQARSWAQLAGERLMAAKAWGCDGAE
jgi:hypothetical protein